MTPFNRSFIPQTAETRRRAKGAAATDGTPTARKTHGGDVRSNVQRKRNPQPEGDGTAPNRSMFAILMERKYKTKNRGPP